MRKIRNLLLFLIIVILLFTGLLTKLLNFFIWLIMLEYSSPNISIIGSILVKILTFFVSYGLVGIVYSTLSFFDSNLMTITYFAVSSLLGFALTYFIWLIESYIKIIAIILGVGSFLIIIYFSIHNYRKKIKLEK